MGVQIHYLGIYVCLCGADGPHQWRQVLMHMWDGQGLSIDCPPPHGHHECDRIDKATLVKRQQLVDSMCDFQMGNLHGGRWQCKFL